MARQLLQQEIQTVSLTSTKKWAVLSAEELDRRQRSKRSSSYLEAIQQIDTGGHIADRSHLDTLINAIKNELPELSIEFLPLGIVARCHLGSPYEVHILDRAGGIMQHFRTWESLPPILERARSLALHTSYVFVEVYADKLIAVMENGETSVVKG